MKTNHCHKTRVRQLKTRHQKSRKALRNRAKRIARRIAPRQFESSTVPLLGRHDLRYEVSQRCVATRFGSLPVLPKLFAQTGLTTAINGALHLLKAHLPYHESDHVYAIAMAAAAEVNRPGNEASHDGAAEYFDRAVKLTREAGFEEVILRGDTDFSQTKYLDGWDAGGVKFVFGYDARENLIEIAEALDEKAWGKFELPEPFDGERGPERSKRINYKDLLVIRKKLGLHPHRGRIRGLVSIHVRYFFFITNFDKTDLCDEAVVQGARWRCNQENLVAALKELGALKLPSHTLNANWAYMVAASLAWTFKAWLGLILPRRDDRTAVLKMEYKHFLNTIVAIPAEAVSAARGTVSRLLAFSGHYGETQQISNRVKNRDIQTRPVTSTR